MKTIWTVAVLLLALCSSYGTYSQEITRDSEISIHFISDGTRDEIRQITAYRIRSVRGNIGSDVECQKQIQDEIVTCEGLREGAYILAVDFTRNTAPKTEPKTFTALYPKDDALLVIVSGEYRQLIWDLRSEFSHRTRGTLKEGTENSSLRVYLGRYGLHVPSQNHATLDASTGAFEVSLLRNSHSLVVQTREDHGQVQTRLIAASDPADDQDTLDLLSWSNTTSIEITTDSPEGWQPKAVYLEQGGREFYSDPSQDRVYSAPKIPPGQYSIRIKASSPLFVSGMAIEGIPNTSGLLKVDEKDGILHVSVKLTQSKNSIQGTVADCTDDLPAKTLTIFDGFEMTSVPVKEDGTFRLYGLPPGQYRILGWSNIEEFPYRNNQLLRRYQGDELTIQIGLTSDITNLQVPCLKFEYPQ